MKKVLVVALVAWLLMMVPVWATQQNQGNDQNQSQNQGQLQGQAQGQLQGQTSTNLNSNVNIVDPKQIMIVDIDGRVTYQPKNNNVNNVNPSATSGSTSSATGGSATAYGGQGGNASVVSNPTSTSNANNSLTVISPENKRELPNIPGAPGVGQLEYRGPYGKGIYDKIVPWKVISGWATPMIDDFPTCFWNCEVEIAQVRRTIFGKGYFRVVSKSEKRILGWIIIRATNPLELWGKVAQYAFDIGAEEVVETAYQSTFANKSGGWNVGIGGGATAISNGNDNVGGSFGGGTGFGSVETGPVEKCEAVFTFYGK